MVDKLTYCWFPDPCSQPCLAPRDRWLQISDIFDMKKLNEKSLYLRVLLKPKVQGGIPSPKISRPPSLARGTPSSDIS